VGPDSFFESVAVTGTSIAIDPAGIAVSVVLLFPDRQAGLDLVDDVATGEKCFVPMRRSHSDPDGAIADLELSAPVNSLGVQD
jgi:hypothetical protein